MNDEPQEVRQALQTTLRRHGQSSAQAEHSSAEQCTGRAQQRTSLNFSMKGMPLINRILSQTLGPHDEDTACLEKTRPRSRGVLVTEGLKTNDGE